MLKKLFVLFISFAAFSQMAFAATYQIDKAHSQVSFIIPHMKFFKVRGAFTEFSGTLEADPSKKSIQAVTGTISVNSIDTKEPKRDDHLRSPDFFDAPNYPEMTFVSKRVEGSGDSITVYGDLTIRGVTKEVKLEGRFLGSLKTPQGERAGFEAAGKINRFDYGLKWNRLLESGGLVVGEEATITIEVEAIRQS